MPAHDLPGTIHFGVDMTYACNYHCPYCVLPPVQKHRPPSEWLRAWERIHRKYGRCYIYMSGGEPSIYPGFYELVRALVPMHTVDLCTNLSWKVEALVPELPSRDFKISATFHPTQMSFTEFLERAVYAREYLPARGPSRKSIYYVVDPAQLDRMPEYAARLEGHGITLMPLPLMVNGELANSAQEKRIIEETSPNSVAEDQKLGYQLQMLSPAGRLCRAGQHYAHIRADGKVDRCTRYEDRQLGDFFSEDFAVWSEPRICTQSFCPFESQWVAEHPVAGRHLAPVNQ